MNTIFNPNIVSKAVLASIVALGLSACGSDYGSDSQDAEPTPAPPPVSPPPKQFNIVEGTDLNSKSHPLLSANPGGPGGSSNQSLRGGDVLLGAEQDDILIGGLGVDTMLGYEGDDIMIGGTEDFNSSVDGDNRGADNRDRALGHDGDDTFIWAPGDGSDFFDGGDGVDVIIFGVLGESRDANNNTEGAPFFAVSPPGSEGSQDFDGIFLDENGQPRVRVSNSPGFCSVLAADENQAALDALKVDNVVRFSIRGIANAFDAGDRNDDDGLRVAVTLKNTEFVVCTARDVDETNSANNIQVLNISGPSPVVASVGDLPEYVQALIE